MIEKVGVYRLQMFKASEPFIAEQVAALPSFERVLLGRNLLGSPDARFDYIACESLGRLSSLGLAITGYSPNFANKIKSSGVGVIHAHFAIDGLSALTIAKQLGLPLVTTLHGFDVTTTRQDLFESMRPALVRYALFGGALRNYGTKFLAVSDFIARKALEAGFPESRLVRHYIGIDTDKFLPAVDRMSGAQRLLHVARLVEKKGTKHLLEALSRLKDKHPDASLEIIGDGPLKPELDRMVNELGLSGRVVFSGSVPHKVITERMRAADLFVLPSVTAENGDSEGLPIVLLEAAACGLPVVSTWHAGIPEAVVHEKTGLLNAEHDVDGLTQSLDILLSSSALRENMGSEARAHVCRNFDIRKQGAELEQIYRELL